MAPWKTPRTTSGDGAPLDGLVERVAVGEGVERGDPVAELVGGAEARDAQRGGVRQRAGELLRPRALPDGAPRAPRGSPAGRRRGSRRRGPGTSSQALPSPGREEVRQLLLRPRCSAGTRSIGWRQAFISSPPRAATSWPITVGRTAGRVLPADQVEELEGLVAEVQQRARRRRRSAPWRR